MIVRKSEAWGIILISLLSLPPSAAADPALHDIEKASNQSLLWGPYRPNLYFGIRPRIPQSLSLGLLWARVDDMRGVQENFRYTCEQNEGMHGYGWEKYDPRHGGVQTIHDAGNNIDITTSFIKDTSEKGGTKGGSWGVRIKGAPREADITTTVVINVNIDGPPGVYNNLEVSNTKGHADGREGLEGDVVLVGETPTLGSFKLTVKGDGNGNKNEHPMHGHVSGQRKPLDRSFVMSKVVATETAWQTKPVLFTLIKQQIDKYFSEYTEENLPPAGQLYTIEHSPASGNVHFIQKVFKGPFEFDVTFDSGSAKEQIQAEDITAGVEKVTKSFDAKFESIFEPQAPFTAKKYLDLSKSLFSNLLGGIGYFYGDWKVDRSYAPEYEEENEGFWEEAAEARARAGFQMEGPNELFTSIPSRPFFPRGFLWDEGFHLMPVLDWDADLTLQIVKSWFALMDEDGWIAREQILGPEARSKVPEEFQVQYPHYANPPTLFLTLTQLIDKLSTGSSSDASQLVTKETARSYLKELYPLLRRHYEWFRRTQKGDISGYDRQATSSKEAYRWRGRTERHCLTSGQDDFPRAQPPHPGELHVDALAWVGLMSSSLSKIAAFVGEEDDAETYNKHLKAIKANLIDLHWSEKEGIFCDATIDQFEEHALVCHKGYVTLLPFMLDLLDPATHPEKISSLLTILKDPTQLWSDHGIRSLSVSSPFYATDENYWRSPIWINMNYLLLTRLHALGSTPTEEDDSSRLAANKLEAARLYNRLRTNLVETVHRSWESTGFAWEQYHPDSGQGQRTQHFTGWTSLIVKVLAMPELPAGAGGDVGPGGGSAADRSKGVRDEL